MDCNISDLVNEEVVLVKGLPGAGKTLLAAKAVSRFNNVAWFTFYETAERLAKYLSSVGLKPPRHVFDLVTVRDKAAVEYIVETTLKLNPDAVVVDGLSALSLGDERELVHAVFYHGISRNIPVILIKEGTDISPAVYLADVILEVEHRLLEGGVSIRYVKVLKARGRFVRYTSLPYVITEEGPVVIEPREETRELTGDRLTTSFPEIDEALGGGVLRGSLVAVVGPVDGLASKLMVLTAAELARRGQKVLYHHHKIVPTFVKFAETLGVKWQRPEIHWFYHPVADHRSSAWWYASASMINRERYDVHIVDQFEQVAVTAGAGLLIEAARLYQSVIDHPVTTVLVFNSHNVWRDISSKVGSLADYVFIFDKDAFTAYTPETAQPLRFKFRVDMEKRRVVYTKE
ncbi:RecA-superfamily ATPase implicated in signal transduction [Pyrobaculum sp. WP30]|nr:RecA-superfamily ATPase implicated in signal transduction [Pyrobaculum sp. WP30]